MSYTKPTLALAITLGVIATASFTRADDAVLPPTVKSIGGEPKASGMTIIPELAVLNSSGATLSSGKLTMTGISGNTVVFTDRPYRAAGHALTSNFVKEWGDGSDSFKNDPPNATVSVFDKDGKTIRDAVVVLKQPTLDGVNLTFDVSVLEGDLDNANGPASLFIDWFSGGHGGGNHDGGDHGGFDHEGGDHLANAGFHAPNPDFNAGWYRHRDHHNGLGYAAAGILGATAGAIAAGIPANYDYPPYTGYTPYSLYPASTCGYYPEPPCY